MTILVTSTQRRGAEVFGERLALELPNYQWSVDFVALGRHTAGPTVSADPLAPGPVGRLDLPVVRHLRHRISQRQPDVVLANGSSTLHYGVVATRSLARRPKLVYASIGDPGFWANTPRRRFTYMAFLKLVDEVFSVSEATGRQLSERFGVPARRVKALPTGVPDELFSVERVPHDGQLRVVYLGSLSKEKDPLTAIKIVDKLRRTTPVTLRMVGSGPLGPDAEEMVQRHALGDVVELVGSVADVKPHLAWADVLLLTSRTEGLPAAPLEAAATGLPSVAFDVGGVRETIRHGVTGAVVPLGDLAGAVAALQAYAIDPALRSAAGDAAHAMAVANFTMEAAVRRYDHALTMLLREDSST